jgi:septum formation protein
MDPLVLASASPARKRLLEQAAIPHRVRVSGVDEEGIRDPDPLRLVQLLAQAKAAAVAELVGAEMGSAEQELVQVEAAQREGEVAPAALESGLGVRMAVLGCDSVLEVDGEVFGKPRDPREAMARWRRLAGGWAELHTGHCLLRLQPDDRSRVSGIRLETVTTRLRFAPISEAEIVAYVATGEPLQCAGGFALEGRGGLMVERIEGCYSNVIGLSLPLLRRWLSDSTRLPAD